MADTWRELLADADARTAAVIREFLAAVSEAEASALQERIAAALAAGRADEVVRILTEAWDAVARRYRVAVAGQLLDALEAGGGIASGGFRVELGLRFDRTNPEAVAFARDRAAALVTGVGTDLRATIRETVTRAFNEQVDVWETARRIRQVIGLRPDQERALWNYRRELKALQASARPVTRVTRMRRLNSKGLTDERMNAWVEKYRQRLLRQRAELIARTEVMAASNAGQLALWRQAVADGQLTREFRKRWLTTPTDRRCPRCAAMEGQTRLLDEPFEAEDGTRVMMPPLHPNCLPGDAVVTPSGPLRAISQRFYDGDLVVVRTASGKRLTCTPNHPVLTRRGWVPARSVNVVGHVVSRRLGDWVGFAERRHDKDVPSRIEEVAKAFRRAQQVPAVPVPVAAEHFHGDGRGSEVAVVWSDSLLRDRPDPALLEPLHQYAFGAARVKPARLASARALQFGLDAISLATPRGLRGRHLPCPRCGIHPLPPQGTRLRASTRSDSGGQQPWPDGAAVTAEVFRDLLFRHAGRIERDQFVDGDVDWTDVAWASSRLVRQPQDPQGDDLRDAELARDVLSGAAGAVFADHVVGVDVVAYRGHLYNLETESHAYLADGIVNHNCMCVGVGVPQPIPPRA